jgi:hypothetical protein
MPLHKNNIESSIQSQVQQMNIVKKKQGHIYTIFKNPCKFVNFYWKHLQHELKQRPPKVGLLGILYKVSQQIRVKETIKEPLNYMA